MAIRETGTHVKALQKSLRILELIRENNGMKLPEITEEMDIARSTVHNHLMTLVHEGYVVRKNNTYHIGLVFLHYGEYARHRKPEYELARNYVEALADENNEEVDFTVPEQGRMISLYHAVGDREFSDLQVGSRFYMHSTAAGKAVLAEMSEDEVNAIIDRWGLPKVTSHTIQSREELRVELERIRNQGYAVNEQELLEGFQSIGMTIHYPDDRIFGALSIGGPTYRIDSEPGSTIVSSLRSKVKEFEQDLIEGSWGEENWWREFRDMSSDDVQ